MFLSCTQHFRFAPATSPPRENRANRLNPKPGIAESEGMHISVCFFNYTTLEYIRHMNTSVTFLNSATHRTAPSPRAATISSLEVRVLCTYMHITTWYTCY